MPQNICFSTPHSFLMWDRQRRRAGEKTQGAQNIKAPALNAQALISSASRTNETCDCICWGARWQKLQRKGSFKS